MDNGGAWTADGIGDLAGRTAVVTGAGTGIGLETARQLVAHGAKVVLTSRDAGRGSQAAQQISSVPGRPGARAEVLDLADLSSVRRFAGAFLHREAGLDILINNAGIAGGPHRRTADGFEAHFGTNYLGHFALTGLLLPALLARPGARVVTLASSVAARGRIDFADLNSERRYGAVAAYSRSKLASMMFATELSRRASAAGLQLASIAADPGIVMTSLMRGKRDQWGRGPRPAELVVAAVQRLLGQAPSDGCLSSLYAATAPGLRGGEYIAPSGRAHKRGTPSPAEPPPNVLDQEAARQLWDASVVLTGVDFSALAPDDAGIIQSGTVRP